MNRTRANRRIIIVVAVGAVLVIAGVLGQLGPLRWVYDHTVVPVSQGASASGSGVGSFFGNLSRVRDLASDNAKLQEENANLKQRLAADAETRRDNDLLRNQLGLEVAGSPQQTAAEVVAFQPDSYRQFITINKGSKDGLKNGLGVMNQGSLIGTISQVQSGTSTVMLVTDPEFKLAVKDQDAPGGPSGLVQGQLGSGLTMTEIDQTATVKPGDTVVSAGLGSLVPAGLLIGQIQSVNSRDNVVFQSAEVSTPLKLSQLRFVFVVAAP